MFIPLSLEGELTLISNFIGIVAGVYPLYTLPLMDTTELVTEETLSIIALGTLVEVCSRLYTVLTDHISEFLIS